MERPKRGSCRRLIPAPQPGRGKGIGFFEDSGFYPDFILWVTRRHGNTWFVEPHGMLNEEHPDTNAKIGLHKKLRAQLAAARKKSRNKNLALDSFIISQTPYDELRKRHGFVWGRAKYAEAHVLFGDEPNHAHIESIVSGAGSCPSTEYEVLVSAGEFFIRRG